MSGQIPLDYVEMSLDEFAKKGGIRNDRRRRGRGHRQGGGNAPVTATQQRRKSIEQHNERSRNHREERKSSRRQSQEKENPHYSSVVFGNGTPEKVLTGRLSESQIPNRGKQKTEQQKPVSLVQAALDRGRELYLQKQARSRGKDTARSKEAGGKRQSLPPQPIKRPVIQHPLSRKLHIVRRGDPGYKRQLRQLRDRTYAVRLVSNSQQRIKQQQTRRVVQRAPVNRVQRDNAPGQRLMGADSRRIALGMSRNAGSTVAAGPLSDRFSSLTFN